MRNDLQMSSGHNLKASSEHVLKRSGLMNNNNLYFGKGTTVPWCTEYNVLSSDNRYAWLFWAPQIKIVIITVDF